MGVVYATHRILYFTESEELAYTAPYINGTIAPQIFIAVLTMLSMLFIRTHVSRGFLMCTILVLGYCIGSLGHLKVQVWPLVTNVFSITLPLISVM